MLDTGSIGERIAAKRKAAGLKQIQLAQRVKYSASHFAGVEQGTRAASPAFVAAVARVLGVDVADLYGQPYADPLAAPSDSDYANIPDLRRALVEYEDVDFRGPLPTLDQLNKELTAVKAAYKKTRYSEVTAKLPDLIRQLCLFAESRAGGVEREQAYSLLTVTYGKALSVLYKLGYFDLAGIATERSRWAASRSGDLLWAVVADFYRALLLLYSGAYGSGIRAVERTYAQIDDMPDSPDVRAVRGALHLRAALLHARSNDSDEAESHLAHAREVGRWVEETNTNRYDTAFRPSNVDIHSVGVSVELYDGTAAVQKAGSIVLPGTVSASRAGHYWIDVARGWQLHGDRERTLATLNKARRVAPQLTRYNPQVHDIARILATEERRQSGSLSNFVGWLGVKL